VELLYFTSSSVRGFGVSANRNITIVGTAGMAITSTAQITLPSTSSLKVYMTGIFIVTEATLNASGYAGALEIYTTTTFPCLVVGSCQVVALLHAPYSVFIAAGNNSSNRLSGRFIAKTIWTGGGYDFHYDEAMSGPGGAPTYTVTRWLEFQSAADRAAVAGLTENYLR
jgi:hypothetical protein